MIEFVVPGIHRDAVTGANSTARSNRVAAMLDIIAIDSCWLASRRCLSGKPRAIDAARKEDWNPSRPI